ncbi:hypothetical protein QUA13_32080 [Microcoleus sp. S28C3]|uniref:hypothetical protein n=1 Tax=Microcoleus sp. S28C3 TaxID=3055414 RepID=UPI002FD09C05
MSGCFIGVLVSREEGRRKKEEGRRKKEEGRRKREEGRRKINYRLPITNWSLD